MSAKSSAQTSIPTSYLLQILNDLAGRKDVGNHISDVCKNVIAGKTPGGPRLSLALDLVHYGEIQDGNWEAIIQGLKWTLSVQDPDAQSLGLQLVKSIPAERLSELLIHDDYGGLFSILTSSKSPDVRSSAVGALGHLLTQPFIVEKIASAPGLASVSSEWWQAILDSMLDDDDEVVGVAFDAVVQLVKQEEAARKLPPSPATAFVFKSYHSVFNGLAEALSQILHRAESLESGGQVPLAVVLSELGAWIVDPKRRELEEVSMPGNAFRWCIGSIGSFLETLLTSVDAAVVTASSEALLKLSELCAENPLEMGGSPAPFNAWASSAISTLINLLEAPELLPGRAQLMKIITSHLGQLEVSVLASTVKSVLPMISKLSGASDRLDALACLWSSVFTMDSMSRKKRRSRGDVVPGATLQAVLEDTFTASIVVGGNKATADTPMHRDIAKASYPAFKQEVVSSAMQLLLHRSSLVQMKAAFAGTSESVSSEGGDAPPGLKGALQQDAQWRILDWLAAAVVALHETQACLGWDNSVMDGYYGLTLPADLWLQVLQRVSQCMYIILQHFGVRTFSTIRSCQEAATDKHIATVLKTVAGEVIEVQKLMKRMILFWGYLSDALKPRVLWIVCHHLELPSVSDEVWKHLKDGILDVLMVRPVEVKKKQLEAQKEAAASGRIAAPIETLYRTKAPKSRVAIDQSEVALEGMIVGLACLNVLAGILVEQIGLPDHKETRDSVKAIAHTLEGVCTKFLESDHITVDLFDQCQGILRTLQWVMSDAAVPEEQVEEEAQAAPPTNNRTVMEIDLSRRVLEGFPFSGPKAHALFMGRRARRHRALLQQIRNAVHNASKSDSKSGEVSVVLAPLGGQSSPVELAAAVGGLDLKGRTHRESEGRNLTGPGDPVRLNIKHRVDPGGRSLTVEITAENQMGSDVTGVIVSLGVDGPVAFHREGTVTWRPERLQAQEPISHQIHLVLLEFGTIEIQPTMEVSLQGFDGPMPTLTCSSYVVPMVDLLEKVDVAPTPASFFQELETWPYATNCTGVCRWPGTTGGKQLLSALDRSPLCRVWPQNFTSLGSFQVLYMAKTFMGVDLAMGITGQLIDLRYMGLAEWTLPVEGEGTGNTGYYLCRFTFSSVSESVVSAIKPQLSELLTGLTEGGVVLGVDPGAGRPPPPPAVNPSIVPQDSHQSSETFSDLQLAVLDEWRRLNA